MYVNKKINKEGLQALQYYIKFSNKTEKGVYTKNMQ